MKLACEWKSKHPEDCSDKLCCCGGHSHKDVKKNLNHNSTHKKYSYRLSRIFNKRFEEQLFNEKTKEGI